MSSYCKCQPWSGEKQGTTYYIHLVGILIFLHPEVPFLWALILHNPRLPDYGNFEAWLYILLGAAGLPCIPKFPKYFILSRCYLEGNSIPQIPWLVLHLQQAFLHAHLIEQQVLVEDVHVLPLSGKVFQTDRIFALNRTCVLLLGSRGTLEYGLSIKVLRFPVYFSGLWAQRAHVFKMKKCL